MCEKRIIWHGGAAADSPHRGEPAATRGKRGKGGAELSGAGESRRGAAGRGAAVSARAKSSRRAHCLREERRGRAGPGAARGPAALSPSAGLRRPGVRLCSAFGGRPAARRLRKVGAGFPPCPLPPPRGWQRPGPARGPRRGGGGASGRSGQPPPWHRGWRAARRAVSQ